MIAIKSKLNDPDLGQLDLVGKSAGDIYEEYGLRVSGLEDHIIEEFDGDVLILHFSEGKVDWFNFLRTSLNLKKEALPEALKFFEERIPKAK